MSDRIKTVLFITHPDVVIDPAVPVPDWVLSERGKARLNTPQARKWVREIDSFWSSMERKAVDAAAILAGDGNVTTLEALGENDRSATGYLSRDAFEAMTDAFFARPFESVQGWERAIDAQARIVAAVEHVIASTQASRIAIVAHGAVGALYLCHLTRSVISRAADQPPGSGGHVFAFADGRLIHGWRAIDG